MPGDLSAEVPLPNMDQSANTTADMGPIPHQPSINPAEASIAETIRTDQGELGKDPHDTFSTIANQPDIADMGEETRKSETIDMVQGPDGKWTARDPKDPNFFYTLQPGSQTEANQGRTTNIEPNGTQTPPKDPWEQWQAGEAQRDAQYQQINQAANEAWANLQQQANQTPEPQMRARSENSNNPTNKDNLSPRERWQKEQEVKGTPADGMDMDPRYLNIKKQLEQQWLAQHPGKDFLSTEGQNYHLGDPSREDQRSLKSDADNRFRRMYPEDAQAYHNKEKTRIYDAPNQDPAIRQIEQDILKATNTDPQVRAANTTRGTDSWGNTWDRINTRESINRWNAFVSQYPEKAKAYADKHPEIKRALEFQERNKAEQPFRIDSKETNLENGQQPFSEPDLNEPREVIGGLSLTFEDAIKFHERNGNHQLAEQLHQAGLAEIKQVDNATLVGETHIRTIVDSQNEQQFQQAITSSEVIVIEHDALINNPYSSLSPEKRFIQEAQEHALTTGKQLRILDSELGTDLERKYALVENEFGLTHEEYAYMISANTLMREYTSGIPINNIDSNLRKRLSSFLKTEGEVSGVVDETVLQFIQSLQDPLRLREFQSVIASFASIDSTSRERAYQQKVAEIVRNNPDIKVAIVVGKNHLEPIARSLTESFLTPPDTASVNAMRIARNNLKGAAN